MDDQFEEEWPFRFDPEVGPEHIEGSRAPGYEDDEVFEGEPEYVEGSRIPGYEKSKDGDEWFVCGLFYDVEQGQWVPGRMTCEDFGRMLAYIS